jgi:hypothetical protein
VPEPASAACRPAAPLRVSRSNPRYFETPDGRAVYLAGSHTWSNAQDASGDGDRPEPFDNRGFLSLLAAGGNTVTRLWRLEGSRTGRGRWVEPQAWLRTGPGLALDCRPRFDLTRVDPAYMARLRARVQAASAQGIHSIVMLFNGWSHERHDAGDPWPWHPFHAANNVNGVDGDPEGQENGRMLASLRLPDALAVQEAFVRHCVEGLRDLDGVLWEVANEVRLTPDSVAWTRHMVRLLRRLQAGMPHPRPIGATAPYPEQLPAAAMRAFTAESGADWVSPHGWYDGWQDDPPEAGGRQVVLLDSDHTFGIGGDAVWVWKGFARGHNLLVMDSLAGRPDLAGRMTPHPEHAEVEESARRGLHGTRDAAVRLDLARAVPAGALCSTGYCLARPGRQYLAFAPEGGRLTLDLSAAAGRRLAAHWLEVDRYDGRLVPAGLVEGGGARTLDPPFAGPAALLLEHPRDARRPPPCGRA